MASAELGLLAGADRVEGCLFGNGERTGNVDLVNLALNFYTQGVHPNLDFSDIQAIIEVVTQCNDLPVHQRHPYAGELVYTAFSGSHQDAIKKGFEDQAKRHAAAAAKGEPQYWDIPYLPIDPVDIGCTYEAVIRVNSQSGKGGIAYIVKQHLKLDLPRKMQVAFYKVIQSIADREAREVTVEDIVQAFKRTYYLGGAYKGRLSLSASRISTEARAESKDLLADQEQCKFDGTISVDGVVRVFRGEGNGPLDALLNALRTNLDIDLTIREYSEHAMEQGQDAKAVSYIELVAPGRDVKETRRSTESWWGVGIGSDISTSGLRAVLSAVNSAIGDRPLPELKLSIGFNAKSGQADVASAITDALHLQIPRRLQASFFEVLQRFAGEHGDDISYEALTQLFKTTYGYETTGSDRFSMNEFKITHVQNGSRRQLRGDFVLDGHVRTITGEGNGPLSAVLAALHSQIDGTLAIREYSEHSLGEGSEVKAASYVELVYEVTGQKKVSAWGIGIDTDVTASGIKAVLSAANRLDVALKK